MKKILLAGLIVLLWAQTTLQAQERPPLVMNILTEWALGGAAVGLAFGGAVWLTDPGRPGNTLGDQLISGAAYGAFAGTAFGIYVMNQTIIAPRFSAIHPNPLHPSRRIGSDPIGEEEKRQDLLAVFTEQKGSSSGWVLPVLNMRF